MPPSSDDPLDLLEWLVALPSATGQEQPLTEQLEAWLSALGLRWRRIPADSGRANLVIDVGSGEPTWLLAGHVDTVPAHPAWRRDPHRLTVADGRASGLGAWDMKAGVAALLALAGTHPTDAPGVRIALLVDEEGESRGADALARCGLLRGIRGAIVPEASPGAPLGGLALTVGRPGRALLEVGITTRGGHAADATARSALELACRAALALATLPTPHHLGLGHGAAVARSLHSDSQGALSVPSSALLCVDRLLVPPETPASAAAALRRHLAETLGLSGTTTAALDGAAEAGLAVHVALRRGPWLEPYCLPRDSPLVARIREALSPSPTLRWDRSPADENRLAMAGVPVVSLGPAGGDAHRAGEWVDVQSLRTLAEALAALVRRPAPEA